ncbi:dihydrolipoamide acetyltransferase family protein [Roseicella aerolata]|uniref:Dihydrolipoamide acetyltransferase component of pyruvate dehydrogenase complex n=1 Tax=Roseicella aerolata TaxID=2883479 RepID=A0A9X1IHN8_9PROT|nr:dihydrolipoamide acetyltransferase family protein [Roseicella aerolata]MCB4825021.1 2-oxo acid dehydrogenase subunit E2 [Roseicella aerolata]
MATRSVKLPDVGEGVAEAELVGWQVKPGDIVREDQVLAEVMTDKATVEIPSPLAGTVVALGGEVGSMLAIGAELVRIEVPEAGDRPAPAASAAAAPASEPVADAAPHAEPEPASRAGRPTASPAIRDRARKAGIDLRQVRGSGPGGRILHEDLDAVLQAGSGRRHAAPEAATQVEEIRLTGLRRRIAERMAEATRRVAHFSYVEEIDVTALEELRGALNADSGAARPRLTLLPFLVRALVRAVPDFPQMNAHYDDAEQVIRRHAALHVGIATQTPSGLTVPVLRHAEARDLWDCAAEVKRLAEAARGGEARREELSGSTITITSLGALGGIASTPVINLPEVAIIGVNRMVIRPVWQHGTFVPRTVMNLSSSFDHRVIDGHDAAAFIQRIKQMLEMPAMLLLER